MNLGLHFEKLGRSGAVSRKAVVWLAIPLIFGLALAGINWEVKRKLERKRTEWKTAALQRLAGLSSRNEEIFDEIETLKAFPIGGEHRWVSDHVLLMTNGEYIVYASWHGANNGFVNHLFLGHGSDGRWLYSTFHFCNSMAMVFGDEPPGSIAEFAKRYSVREFDGKSDECLKKTWPIKESARIIQRQLKVFTRENFMTDIRTPDAVNRRFEIIGDAPPTCMGPSSKQQPR